MDNHLLKLIGDLDAVLRAQLEGHERLLTWLDHKRTALRAADAGEVTRCSREEHQCFQAVSELEKRRLTLVAELTRLIDPSASAPMRMEELAGRLPEPHGTALRARREQLLERIHRVRERTGAVQAATQLLVGHMQSLIQRVGAACTGVSYGAGGRTPRAAMKLSTFSATA